MAKFIKQGYEIIDNLDPNYIMKKIERIGRVCYKSEDKMTTDSAERFIRMIIKRGHESVLEHVSFSVRFITDRGVSHEIVRHRIASFSQESTRYCNYSSDKFGGDVSFIIPTFFEESHLKDGDKKYEKWVEEMMNIERTYLNLLEDGASPQEARTVLPNSLKTEIVVTMNLREWRHFFKLRTAPAAHPQMRELVSPLLSEMKELLPAVFEDIEG